MKIRLAKPEIPLSAQENLNEIIRSGMFVQGKFVAAFERKLSEFVGLSHVCAVSSGSSALLLAMVALGLKRGDSVIVPDFTFPAAANAALNLGCEVIPADVESETFCIDPESFRQSIKDNTKAVVAVHQFGIPCGIEIIKKIAFENGLFLIEDAACALGGKIDGVSFGCHGDVGVFSFHPRKIITTGEGGATVTRDLALHEKIVALRNHGRDSRDSTAPFFTPGYNMRMGEINAALGLPQVERLNEIIKLRKAAFELYRELLSGVEHVRIPAGYSREGCVYQSLVVILDRDIDRDSVITKMVNSGVETAVGGYSLTLQRYFSGSGNCPVGQMLAKKSLAMPLYPELTPEEIESAVRCLKEAIKESKTA